MIPWQHILSSLDPEYLKCVNALEDGPQYRCGLSKKGKYTVLQLHEYWQIDDKLYDTTDKHVRFDDHISWIEEQLITWPDVKRMAWDQWYFKYQRDAKKFITLFNMKWLS